VPQRVAPAAQAAPQALLLQTIPASHAVEHPPQWLASEGKQAPLQAIPVTHWQEPSWQICPVEQGIPQPPQLSGSFVTNKHCWPHGTWSPGHVRPLPAGVSFDPQDEISSAMPKETTVRIVAGLRSRCPLRQVTAASGVLVLVDGRAFMATFTVGRNWRQSYAKPSVGRPGFVTRGGLGRGHRPGRVACREVGTWAIREGMTARICHALSKKRRNNCSLLLAISVAFVCSAASSKTQPRHSSYEASRGEVGRRPRCRFSLLPFPQQLSADRRGARR
jgi:hypothetical protein